MVFGLRQHLVDGVNVNAFLSKSIGKAEGWDGLLWSYGMHHFHLGRETGKDGFVKRSKHLLFAIVAPTDAYFVDVRPHPPKDGIGWVSQELLEIVHSNWPELIEEKVLHGVSGDQLTDEEMQELRRKNTNYAMNIGGKAIAPPARRLGDPTPARTPVPRRGPPQRRSPPSGRPGPAREGV